MRVADRTCAADAPHVERGLCPYCEKPPAKLVDIYLEAFRIDRIKIHLLEVIILELLEPILVDR